MFGAVQVFICQAFATGRAIDRRDGEVRDLVVTATAHAVETVCEAIDWVHQAAWSFGRCCFATADWESFNGQLIATDWQALNWELVTADGQTFNRELVTANPWGCVSDWKLASNWKLSANGKFWCANTRSGVRQLVSWQSTAEGGQLGSGGSNQSCEHDCLEECHCRSFAGFRVALRLELVQMVCDVLNLGAFGFYTFARSLSWSYHGASNMQLALVTGNYETY
jgi:hypothetical protein